MASGGVKRAFFGGEDGMVASPSRLSRGYCMWEGGSIKLEIEGELLALPYVTGRGGVGDRRC